MSALGQFFMGKFWGKLPSQLSTRHIPRPITAHRGLQDSQQGVNISKDGQTSELISIHPLANLENKFVQIQTLFSMTNMHGDHIYIMIPKII